MIQYFFDFDKKRGYQFFKSFAILAFLTVAMLYFVSRKDNDIDQFKSMLDEVPKSTGDFSLVIGLVAFSFSQSVHIP